jgi:hypothetical protein
MTRATLIDTHIHSHSLTNSLTHSLTHAHTHTHACAHIHTHVPTLESFKLHPLVFFFFEFFQVPNQNAGHPVSIPGPGDHGPARGPAATLFRAGFSVYGYVASTASFFLFCFNANAINQSINQLTVCFDLNQRFHIFFSFFFPYSTAGGLGAPRDAACACF